VFRANGASVPPLAALVVRASEPHVALRQLHVHFDALRTLRLIHRGRDAALPSLPWREALQRASFVEPIDGNETPARIGELLWQEERRRLHGRTLGVDLAVPDQWASSMSLSDDAC
jgi:hypothetical protein